MRIKEGTSSTIVNEKQHVIVPQSTRRTLDLPRATGVGAVILAAGPSTRMGTPKQLLQFGGETLVKRAACVALEAGCRPVIVVTGAHAAETREALRGLGVNEAENERWESGISSSVRVGVDALVTMTPHARGVVLMLCDQPLVTREIIAELLVAHRKTDRGIVASSYGGSCGVPALFSRKYFAELTRLQGGLGAKQLIQKRIADVQLLDFPDGEIDIDTPDDFARLT